MLNILKFSALIKITYFTIIYNFIYDRCHFLIPVRRAVPVRTDFSETLLIWTDFEDPFELKNI